MQKTTIQITQDTLERLKNIKKYDRQSYDDLINTIQSEDIIILYKNAFRNVDLRFKDLKESQIKAFTGKLIGDLSLFKNKIKK